MIGVSVPRYTLGWHSRNITASVDEEEARHDQAAARLVSERRGSLHHPNPAGESPDRGNTRAHRMFLLAHRSDLNASCCACVCQVLEKTLYVALAHALFIEKRSSSSSSSGTQTASWPSKEEFKSVAKLVTRAFNEMPCYDSIIPLLLEKENLLDLSHEHLLIPGTLTTRGDSFHGDLTFI